MFGWFGKQSRVSRIWEVGWFNPGFLLPEGPCPGHVIAGLPVARVLVFGASGCQAPCLQGNSGRRWWPSWVETTLSPTCISSATLAWGCCVTHASGAKPASSSLLTLPHTALLQSPQMTSKGFDYLALSFLPYLPR